MGFFQYIKAVIKAVAEGHRIAKLTTEELLALDDETLYFTIHLRLIWERRWKKSRDNYAEIYYDAKRVFYVVEQYDEEINNGGLCQYFTNPSRLAAPYLLSSLNEIGASASAKLFSDFLTTNNIDVKDLSSFIIKDLSEFAKQNKRYPFDAYDDAFYKLCKEKPLNEYLIAYVRKHIDEFAME